MTARRVYFVSESTGITAEAMGRSLLSQFEGAVAFETVYLPFINTKDKARRLVAEIEEMASSGQPRPVLFATMLEPSVQALLKSSPCLYLELFDTYLPRLEKEFGICPSGRMGLKHGIADSDHYERRMSIINFAMANDDGVRPDRFGDADVVLIGVSRSGKTPTCLYLAIHFGLRAANYPLTEEDFEKDEIPEVLTRYRDKMFGLSIQPERLHRIREERRPGSGYASLATCQAEVRHAERIFEKLKIRVLDTTANSIEEISSRIAKKLKQAG